MTGRPSRLGVGQASGLWTLPAVVLISATILALLYAYDPVDYHAVLQAWGFRAYRTPFLDTATLLSQIACSRHVNVYVSNPCIILGVPFDYSPLWLQFGFLARAQDSSTAIGLVGIAAFAAATTVLPRPPSRHGRLLMVLGVLAPVTVFALERGNADVLVFVLVAAGLFLLDRRFAVRSVGYGLFLAAALLKFYPLVLLLFLLRERPSRLGMGALAVGSILGLFVARYGSDILRALAQVPHPSPFEDGFGAVQFPKGLASIANTPDLAPVMEIVMIAAAFVAALRIARGPSFTEAMLPLSRREADCLLAGALLVVLCFFAVGNIGYRGVLLLFTLPGLLTLSQCRAAGFIVRLSPQVALLSMWNLVPMVWLGPHGLWQAVSGPAQFFCFWFLREIVWWWTATVLLAVVIHQLAHMYRLQLGRFHGREAP